MTVEELIEKLRICRPWVNVLIKSEGCYGENFTLDDSADAALIFDCDGSDEEAHE